MVMCIEPDEAAEILSRSEYPCVFTGAGVSAESGIPTFRDGGFWDEFPPDQFANWAGLTRLAAKDPRRLGEFVLAVIGPIAKAKPNAAHVAIANWQQRCPVTVVTQNVDGLHQRAGSKTVHEVHGSLLGRRTDSGEPIEPLSHEALQQMVDRLEKRPRSIIGVMRAIRPFFGRRGLSFIRPSIVLFGDAMAEPDWTLAEQAARSCDAMLTVGTSSQVYPAAYIPVWAHERGVPVITVDPKQPEINGGYWVEGTASEIVPKILGASSRPQ